jgi:outer membrane protein OmpA-like peptidoglycan-associated protein
MNRTQSLSLIALFLVGCTSTPNERHAGVYAFLDPATGRTYNLPLPYNLSKGRDSTTVATATGATTTKGLDESLFGVRERKSAAQDGPVAVASVGSLSAVNPLDVAERVAFVEPARAVLSPTRGPREIAEVTPRLRDPLPSMNLKLDTEFASAKRLVMFALGIASLGPTGKLAIAELVPWAKQAEKVHVRGGADSSGDAWRNRELALSRAAVVSSAFVAAGVDRNKISKSVCPNCYVASNDTEEGRRLNRRVEVELVLQKELFAQLPSPVHALEPPGSMSLMHATALRTPAR